MADKYLNEYKQSKNKEDFVKLLLNKYKKMNIKTAQRRWYDYKKINRVPEQFEGFNVDDIHGIKKLMIKDMIRLKMPITREYLKQHGFTDAEVNWLINNKFIKSM